MSQDTFNVLLVFVGAVIVAVIFVLDRANKRASDALPPATADLLRGLISALETLAERTETTRDDEVVGLARQLIDKLSPPPTPPVS